jgi:hypothetical protein
MIHSVQFHNISPKDIVGKVSPFKFEQKFAAYVKSESEEAYRGIQVEDLREVLFQAYPGDELEYGGFTIRVKEKPSMLHCVADLFFACEDDGRIEEEGGIILYPNLLISYAEVGQRAYLTFFPLEEGQT